MSAFRLCANIQILQLQMGDIIEEELEVERGDSRFRIAFAAQDHEDVHAAIPIPAKPIIVM